MRITGVHTAVVEANYDWTFVRVDAGDLSGIGECFCAPGLTAIVRDLTPLLLGEDARDVDRLWAKLRWGCSGAGSSAGIVYNAISGIEAAVWDLVGQSYGVPIHRLLGGRFRDSVRMYADCHAGEALHSMNATMVSRPARWGDEVAPVAGGVVNPEHGRAYAKAAPDEVFTPELYAARARQVVADLGFSALKFDLDVPTPYMADTASGTPLAYARPCSGLRMAPVANASGGSCAQRGARSTIVASIECSASPAWQSAYIRTESRKRPPSSRWIGTPYSWPTRSQSAASIPEIAL